MTNCYRFSANFRRRTRSAAAEAAARSTAPASLTGAVSSVRNMSASDGDMLRPAWSHFCLRKKCDRCAKAIYERGQARHAGHHPSRSWHRRRRGTEHAEQADQLSSLGTLLPLSLRSPARCLPVGTTSRAPAPTTAAKAANTTRKAAADRAADDMADRATLEQKHGQRRLDANTLIPQIWIFPNSIYLDTKSISSLNNCEYRYPPCHRLYGNTVATSGAHRDCIWRMHTASTLYKRVGVVQPARLD